MRKNAKDLDCKNDISGDIIYMQTQGILFSDREINERYEGKRMTERRLIGKRIEKIVPDREMVLEYYMLEDTDEDSQTVTYGAMIRKTDEGREEIETVKGITHSKEVIHELTELLLKHIVTPVAMVDIIDDYVTEKLCS